jgi:hypothetical protein
MQHECLGATSGHKGSTLCIIPKCRTYAGFYISNEVGWQLNTQGMGWVGGSFATWYHNRSILSTSMLLLLLWLNECVWVGCSYWRCAGVQAPPSTSVFHSFENILCSKQTKANKDSEHFWLQSVFFDFASRQSRTVFIYVGHYYEGPGI